MAGKAKQTENNGYRTLTIIWLVVSAALGYPLFNLLQSMGFNQALSGVAVFLGICLLYDIPYRAKVKAQHEAAMARTTQWRY
jgi:hypothetical protein